MSESGSDIVVSLQHAARPKYPNYADYAKRFESFDACPKNLPEKKDDLVEAGLFYTGVLDLVRCYFCGIGLKDWSQDDVPMKEHARYCSDCPYVLLVKGQAYVEKVRREEKAVEYMFRRHGSQRKKSSATSVLAWATSLIKDLMTFLDDTLKTTTDIMSLLVELCPQLFPDLSREPTEQDLVTLAEAIGENYRFLGLDLGLSVAKLDQISLDNPTTVMRTYNMLREWSGKNPLKATLSSLIQTMKSCRSVNIDWNQIGKVCMVS